MCTLSEESAACLRHPGQPETICADGLGPDLASPAPAQERAEGGGGGGGGSAELAEDPAALIAEMMANSLVSQLWADYVRTMTPVFQVRAGTARAGSFLGLVCIDAWCGLRRSVLRGRWYRNERGGRGWRKNNESWVCSYRGPVI